MGTNSSSTRNDGTSPSPSRESELLFFFADAAAAVDVLPLLQRYVVGSLPGIGDVRDISLLSVDSATTRVEEWLEATIAFEIVRAEQWWILPPQSRAALRDIFDRFSRRQSESFERVYVHSRLDSCPHIERFRRAWRADHLLPTNPCTLGIG